jgi:hypothetical protein
MILCAKCHHPAPVYALVLWHGGNGFRRYRLCPKCKALVQAEPIKKMVRVEKDEAKNERIG